MSNIENHKSALARIQENPSEWIVFTVITGLLASIPILNFVILLNAQKAVIRYLEGKQGLPSLDDLLQFEKLSDAILVAIFISIANFIGLLACGIGAFFAMILLIFAQQLVADEQFAPMEACKASFEYSKERFGDITSFWLVELLLIMGWSMLIFVTCGLATLIFVPIMLIVMAQFYLAHKKGILLMAQQKAIPSLK